MKFSTSILLLFTGGSLASASTSLRNLQQTACLNYADIEFGACDFPSILATVDKALINVEGCTNNARQEIKLLAKTNDISVARAMFTADCEAVRKPCLNMEVDLLFPNCILSTVWSTIDAALAANSCTHNKQVELMLQFETKDWAVAKQATVDFCLASLRPCLNYADIEFGACDFSSILATISEATANVEGCTNDPRQEIKLLVETTDLNVARAQLIADCEANRTPCLNLEDLVFPNCSWSSVLSTVNTALATKACTHNTQVELMLQFETDDWNVAKQAALDVCVSSLKPCVEDLQSIVVPPNCNQAAQLVKDVVAKSGCSHNALQEVQLHMGDVTWAQAMTDLKATCESQRKSCTTWADVEVNGCDDRSIMIAIREQMADDCTHNVNKEIQLLSGKSKLDEAKKYLHDMCSLAWEGVETSKFTDIDAEFDATFMNSYVAGDTFLNLETGNFQGADNPQFPTEGTRAREVGASIDLFRDDQAATTVLESIGDVSSCQNQAIMCCFGRDRQSNDNNGDCADNDCEDQGPADNSNLCYAGEIGQPGFMAYPDATEGSIHCHGLAWDSDENDFTARLRYNNLFYVSLYDHMYSRGYVENMVDRADVPMCGCIEDMPPVVRSDCTELAVSATFILNTDANGLLVAEAVSDSLEIDFNACKGVDPDDTTTREDNDLASYVAKLVKRNQMSEATQAEIYKTLVGYTEPNDNDNEAACDAVTPAT